MIDMGVSEKHCIYLALVKSSQIRKQSSISLV